MKFRLLFLFFALTLGNFLFAGMVSTVDASVAFERSFFQGIALLAFHLTTYFIPLEGND